MLRKMKVLINKWKEQKGLTLIELLAVIVILGIIAGIAVPTIGGIIENSKEKAHDANIQMFENAGRLAVASNEKPKDGKAWTLEELVKEEFLAEVPVSPWDENKDYNGTVSAEDGSYKAGNNDVKKPN
jgi:type IV pilus assembly protein PilA